MQTDNKVDLDIRQFAKHVNRVGPQKAFLDFLYGMFVVADEVLKTNKVPAPTAKEKKS